ncbi:hypothetical protein D3C76_1783040 [compost metagenome]
MHEGHQLWHLGHLDALGHDGACCATYQQGANHIGHTRVRHPCTQLINKADGGEDGDPHADHAEQVAAP